MLIFLIWVLSLVTATLLGVPIGVSLPSISTVSLLFWLITRTRRESDDLKLSRNRLPYLRTTGKDLYLRKASARYQRSTLPPLSKKWPSHDD